MMIPFFLVYIVCLSNVVLGDNYTHTSSSNLIPLKFQDLNDLNFIKGQVFLASNDRNLDETTFNEVARSYAKEVEVRIIDGPVVKNDLTVPVSNCLISYEGSGGSIGYSGSFGISSSIAVDGTIAALMLTIDPTLTVGKSLSLSLSYSCSASAGGVAQLQLTPIYVSFTYQEKGNYVKSLTKEVVHLADSWSAIKAGSLPILQTPVFHCVNSSAAICGLPPTRVILPSSF